MPGLLGTSLNTDDILETLRGIGRGLNFGGTSGMIGAPVDMATTVLNNPGLLHPGLLGVQGLGIKDPVGGSKWIEQKLQNQGLLPQRQGNWQEGVGELASTFVNPMTAAAVAGPKLYAAEQRAIENAMAPTTLNKQAGAIVWHGSPHKFDKFDSKKIGTGEGAQAYGHGLYFAESPKVAEGYRKKLSGVDGYDPAKHIEGIADAWNLNLAKQAIQKFNGDYEGAISRLQSLKPNVALPQSVIDRNIEALAKKQVFLDPKGALYKVDLPDEAIAKMLDWDKPLSQQAPAVQAAYKKYLKSPQASEYAKSWTRYKDGMRLDQAEPLLKNPGGENLYKNAFPSREAANQWAFENGIPGIRYLDGGSRGAGSGTSNFVVFPGNEDLLRILERNGQPIGLLGR